MINISPVFRSRISEGFYSFDLIAVDSETLVSSLVGYCTSNIKTNCTYVGLNKSIPVSQEELTELSYCALKEAQNVESIFS